MSAQTFHRFLELPCELRDLIWEAGWRHYDTRIKCQPASESEISACLMDAGLWAACRESRRVMQRRMRQHGLLDADEENKSLCLKGPKPATLIIDQLKDIVCFQLSDWYEDSDWTTRFRFWLSYADSTEEEGVPHKVAFEIDGIWDHEHACWYKMVRAISSYNRNDDDQCPFLDISIIDKEIHWFRDHTTVDDTYADSDNEFTVVQWKNLCRCNQRGIWSSALAFLMYLNWGYREHIDGVTYFTHRVSILVRRDNEVMACQSCQTRAQAENGWHTDHLLDGMDVPTDEGDENVEESNREEQEPETE